MRGSALAACKGIPCAAPRSPFDVVLPKLSHKLWGRPLRLLCRLPSPGSVSQSGGGGWGVIEEREGREQERERAGGGGTKDVCVCGGGGVKKWQ